MYPLHQIFAEISKDLQQALVQQFGLLMFIDCSIHVQMPQI